MILSIIDIILLTAVVELLEASEPQGDGAVDWNLDDVNLDNGEYSYDGGGGYEYSIYCLILGRLWRWGGLSRGRFS